MSRLSISEIKQKFLSLTLDEKKAIIENCQGQYLNKGIKDSEEKDLIPNLELFLDIHFENEEARLKYIISLLEAKIEYLHEYFDDFIIQETLYIGDDQEEDEEVDEEISELLFNAWLLYGKWNQGYKTFL